MESRWSLMQRRKDQHKAVRAALLPYQRPAGPPYLVCMLWEHSRLADDDGLSSALKHVRDEIASYLGISDGDRAAARWQVGQQIIHEQIEVLDPKTWKLGKVWANRVRILIFSAAMSK